MLKMHCNGKQILFNFSIKCEGDGIEFYCKCLSFVVLGITPLVTTKSIDEYDKDKG